MEVTLCVKYSQTEWGQYVAVVGDHPFLGAWSNAIALKCENFPLWSTTICLPLNTAKILYKFVLCGPDASILLWEPIPHDRSLIIIDGTNTNTNINRNSNSNRHIKYETTFGSLLSNISRSYVAPGCDSTNRETDPENDSTPQSHQSAPQFTATLSTPTAAATMDAEKKDEGAVRYTSPRGIMDGIFEPLEHQGETAAASCGSAERGEGSVRDTADNDNDNNNFVDEASQSPIRVKRNLAFDFNDDGFTGIPGIPGTSSPGSPRGVMDDARSSLSVVSDSDIDAVRRSNDDLLLNTVEKSLDTDLALVACALEETLAMAAVARKKIRSMLPHKSPPSASSCCSNNGDEEYIAANARSLDQELKDALRNAHEVRDLLQDACQRMRDLHVTTGRARRRRSTRN